MAEALGKDERDIIPQIVWTSVTVQAVMGFVGALALFGITDLLVDRVLNVRRTPRRSKATFHLLAFSIPVVLASSSLSGVLEAAQRFDLVNALRVPSSILTYLLPLVGLYLGLGLPEIVTLILLSKKVRH